ncbi:hypothetical protein AB0D27_11265 [Streptomyces sp. NPDC048415]|uniref:hypothetical protein n=1 Tax=Streptomyces sp. NPDC048415 TaxID=3154822 RepID=UPI003426E796
MQPAFTRGFRLHLSDGRYLDGAEFPSGRVYVVDDPEYGLATAATSMDYLLKGYHGARVEWPGDLLVPRALFQDLAAVAAELAAASPGLTADRARIVLGRLTEYVGADVVTPPGQSAAADGFDYPRDPDAEQILNTLPPEAQRRIRAQLTAEAAKDRTENH